MSLFNTLYKNATRGSGRDFIMFLMASVSCSSVEGSFLGLVDFNEWKARKKAFKYVS